MADWSMLPCDILAEIALKLDQPDDFIYFSAVCRSWNHASSLVKSIRNPNLVMPWLFLAENTNENPDCLRKVYNLSNDKCYRLKVPESFGARCWGSSYGWIALQTFDYQVHLFNPLTKVRITSLPSILTMSHQPNDPPEPANPDLQPNDPPDNPDLEPNDHPHNPDLEPNDPPEPANPDLEPNDPPDNPDLEPNDPPHNPDLEPIDPPHNPDLEPNDPPEPDNLEPNDPLEEQQWYFNNFDNDPLEEQQWYFNNFVMRLVVLKMPRNQPLDDDGGGGDSNLLIAAIFSDESLAFARPGDQSWTYIVSEATDVACWKDRIYIVRCDGQLLYCDIKGCGDLKDVKVMEYAPSCRSKLDGYDKVFLLDLCGDLVMVVRSKTDFFTGSCLTIRFDVYRLDNKIKKWVEIKDIGKFSIFVGHHSSMACPISVANNCTSNCIYFTDDESSEWREVPGFGGDDMGVYSIGSRVIKNFYFGDDTNSPFCPPIFFLPNCCSTS